jgi:hypothetical protein
MSFVIKDKNSIYEMNNVKNSRYKMHRSLHFTLSLCSVAMAYQGWGEGGNAGGKV